MEQHFQDVAQNIIHDKIQTICWSFILKNNTKTDPTTMSWDYVFRNTFYSKFHWFNGNLG